MIKANFNISAVGNIMTLDASKSQGVPTKWEWIFKDNIGEDFKPEVLHGELSGRIELPGILSVKLPIEVITVTLRLVYFGDVSEMSIVHQVKK